MAYQVLARKWRPQVFEDVIGQVHIARALQNAVKAKKVAHAYLLSGPRGVGKTTMARILAKALNCAQGPTPNPCNQCDPCQEIMNGVSVDVLEIDGASNTSVDNIRELREMVKYVPIQGKHKVYIIDEVHMLSNSAFNALLKTLEEPPPHIVFIFATTELHKIPATIRSRCQHFQFKKISRKDIVARVGHIASQEAIEIGDQELFLLAKGAEGSVRDALSLLDQVLAYGGTKIIQEDLLTIMGVVKHQQLLAMVSAIQRKDPSNAIELVRELVDQGHDLRHFCHELVEVVRDLIMLKIAKQPEDILDCSSEELEELKVFSEGFSVEELQWVFNIFSQAYEEMKNFFYPPFMLEMAVVRAARIEPLEPIERTLEKVMGLEERLNQSVNIAPPSPTSGGSPPIHPVNRSESIERKQNEKPQNRTEAYSSKPDPPVVAPDVQSEASGNISEGVSPEAPAAVPEPVSSGSGSEIVSPNISQDWQRVVQIIKAQRPYLASYLDRGILVKATETELVIGFPQTSSFLIDLIQKEENQSLIRSVLKECFQKTLKLSAILLNDRSVMERRSKDIHPAVKEALKILGGEIIDPKSLS